MRCSSARDVVIGPAIPEFQDLYDIHTGVYTNVDVHMYRELHTCTFKEPFETSSMAFALSNSFLHCRLPLIVVHMKPSLIPHLSFLPPYRSFLGFATSDHHPKGKKAKVVSIHKRTS